MARAIGLYSITLDPAVKYGLIVFTVSRLFFLLWTVFLTAVQPVPSDSDEMLRPYLGEPILTSGLSGTLLGPWQRFDSQHYLRIARLGYEIEEDSVFPPLYPLSIKALGSLFPNETSTGVRNLTAAILISNIAFLGTLILLFRMTQEELDLQAAKRAVIYLAIFPTAFFLLAAYTESIFLFLAIAAVRLACQERFWLAGLAGFFAPLSRLTGWILTLPMLYEYLQQRKFQLRHIRLDILATLMPLIGIGAFLGWRHYSGLSPLAEIYSKYWHQRIGIPGADMLTAIRTMISGEAPFILFLDFLIVILLLIASWAVFKKLGASYGLYCAALLFFMLLPASDLKPLYSFTRYALVFFPMFMILGQAGRNPWINRAIVYPSIALLLYLSGQFFMWGWVA